MPSLQIVVFGEVLFDVFPDGRRVLGGAPFNVAWHLQGFGLTPLFISRVGRDRDGDRVLEAMTSWGMTTSYVQIDDNHPTGRVQVKIEDGNPSFQIASDQAYDFIDPVRVPEPGTDSRRLLYHGSLGIRAAPSWNALQGLSSPSDRVVCDLNLRAPWWTRPRVDWCLRRVSWLKISSGELSRLTDLQAESDLECLRAARQLKRDFEIPNLVITRGGHGALGLFVRAEPVWQDATIRRSIVDTVGAGDAFSAVLILGIDRGWNPEVILNKAAEFAADICGQRGATSSDRSIYEGLEAFERN